jgi:hypothetical protein
MITVLLASALWAIPPVAAPTDQVLMRAWYVQNDTCRGASDEEMSDKACRWRDDTGKILSARGWEWSSRYGWRRTR